MNEALTNLPLDRKVWPTEDTSRVPLWVYSDRENYQRELDRIFYGPHWHFVGVDCEIEKVGDYKRKTIGERSVLMVRDKEGNVNVLLNSCAHRGTEVCQKTSGNDGPVLRCPYHHWSYDLKGNLQGVPFRRGVKGQGGFPEDFDPAQHSLTRLRVETVNGAVFATFDHDAPAFADYVGPIMMRYLTRVFNGKKLRVLGHQRQKLKGNWKLYMENIKDPYHATILHVFLVSFGIYRIDQIGVTEQDERTGAHCVFASIRNKPDEAKGTEEMASFKADYKLNDPTMVVPVPEFPDDISIMIQTLFPSLIVQQQTNSLQLRYIIPLGPDAFELVWTYLGYADDDEDMVLRRLRMANLSGPSGYISVDDSEVMEFSGAGVRANPGGASVLELDGHSPWPTEEHHMVTESAIRGFYHHYRDVMGYV